MTIPEQKQLPLAVYDRIDPMPFIEKFGKVFALTGAGGCKTIQDGELMALACLCERKTIFQIAARFHLMDGKLVTKAESMLADFKRAGGQIRWIKNGSDCREAHLELTKGDVKSDYSFTIERAMAAGYVKDKSNWVKRPDQMLRSRCITDLMRMQWPEISDGYYSEDEMADENDGRQSASVIQAASAGPSADVPVRRTRKAKSVNANEIENASMTTEDDVNKEGDRIPSSADGIVEAEIVKPEPQNVSEQVKPAQQPPFDAGMQTTPVPATASTSEKSSFRAEILELESLIAKCGWPNEAVIAKANQKHGTSFTSFEQFSDEQIEAFTANIRAILQKSEAENKS